MTRYYIFYATILCFVAIGRLIGMRNRVGFLLIPLTISVLFVGFRGNVGTDTYSYRAYFETFGSTKDVFVFEPGFSAFTQIIKLVSDDDQFFLFSLAMLNGVLLCLILREVKEKDLFFLFYLSTYYVMMEFNLLRFGVALLLVGYALVRKLNEKKGDAISYISAFLVHYATLVVSYLFIRKRNFVIYTLLLVTIAMSAYTMISTKIGAYFLSSSILATSYKVSVGDLLEASVIAFLFQKNRRYLDNRIILLAIAYIVLKQFSFMFDMLDRVSVVCGFTVFIFLFNIKQEKLSRYAIILLTCFNLYRSLSFVQSSDAAMDALKQKAPIFNLMYSQTRWVPYKFFWE